MPRILIVDDEPDFCYFVKKNLELRKGYEVFICTEGTQALATIKKLKPDIVLLDIIQPEITGGEIAEQMRAFPSTSHIPFIFLTAVVHECETKTNDGRIGGHLFLAKPVQVSKLVEVIETTLKSVNDAR